MNYYKDDTLELMLRDAENYIEELKLEILNLKSRHSRNKEIETTKTEKSPIKKIDLTKLGKPEEIKKTSSVNDYAKVARGLANMIPTKHKPAQGTTKSKGPKSLEYVGNRMRKGKNIYVRFNDEELSFDSVNEAAAWHKDTKGNKGKIKTIASNISFQTRPGSKKSHVNGLVYYYKGDE